ncbi:MAG: hypothetical protein ACXIUV_06225 [Alkalilacustris sp.]
MTRDAQLAGLATLAVMMRDARLAELQKATTARAQAEARMQALSASPDLSAATPEEAMAALTLAAARARWLERERSRGNAVLARAHVAEQAARKAAARAFGRADALRRLAETDRKA